jgi:hypothetical protein
MSINLSAIAIREPAVLIKLNSEGGPVAYFWSQKEFDLVPVIEYFDVPAAVHAHAEKRIKSLYWSVETTLVGEFEYLTTLFPALSASLGASVLGTTDTAWKLITQSGRQWLFPRGGFIERPLISCVPGKTLFGASKFAAVCASDKEPGEAGAFYLYSEGQTFPDYASFDPTKILSLAPLVSYSGLMSNAQGEQGVEIQFAWQTKEVRTSNLIRDWTITSQEFTAKLKPFGIAFADIMTACGYDQAMGSRLPTQTFSAFFNGFYCELRGATCEQARFKLGPESDFIDGLVFRASQTYNSNAQLAPAYLDVSD